MNILFISHKLYPEFEVYENKKLIVHIKIDDASRAFRIKFEDTRRVFLIADEVIRKTKIVTLLNEYSQQLGFLTKGNSSGSAGEIEIEGTQYTYGLNDAPPTEVNLYGHHNLQPILSCKLEMEAAFPHENYISYLLFSLAWFTFVTSEQASLQLAKAS